MKVWIFFVLFVAGHAMAAPVSLTAVFTVVFLSLSVFIRLLLWCFLSVSSSILHSVCIYHFNRAVSPVSPGPGTAQYDMKWVHTVGHKPWCGPDLTSDQTPWIWVWVQIDGVLFGLYLLCLCLIILFDVVFAFQTEEEVIVEEPLVEEMVVEVSQRFGHKHTW